MAKRTDQQIVDTANELARTFYLGMGYTVRVGYRFDLAAHPQESMCWHMACKAFEIINGTDVENALAELEL